MKDHLKINIEGQDLDFKIVPFGYTKEKSKFLCELKLEFETTADKLVNLFKLYEKLEKIEQKQFSKDEEGNPIYLNDLWDIDLKFKRFEEEKL